MTTHVKLNALIDTHPELEKAGWAARQVFMLLLRVSAAHGFGGRFTAEYASPSWLALRWGLTAGDVPGGATPDEFITRAVCRLMEWGVVVGDEHGVLTIADWAGCLPDAPCESTMQALSEERQQSLRKQGAAERRLWRQRRLELEVNGRGTNVEED